MIKLREGDTVRVKVATRDKHLIGKKAVVTSVKDRQVFLQKAKFPWEEGPALEFVSRSKFAEGDIVRINGLKKDVEFNGKIGMIQEVNSKGYVIEEDLFKAKNLAPASPNYVVIDAKHSLFGFFETQDDVKAWYTKNWWGAYQPVVLKISDVYTFEKGISLIAK